MQKKSGVHLRIDWRKVNQAEDLKYIHWRDALWSSMARIKLYNHKYISNLWLGEEKVVKLNAQSHSGDIPYKCYLCRIEQINKEWFTNAYRKSSSFSFVHFEFTWLSVNNRKPVLFLLKAMVEFRHIFGQMKDPKLQSFTLM